MTAADLPACADIFYAAADELYSRWNQPSLPRDPEGLARFFANVAFGDGGRGWVAGPSGAAPQGFGIAIEREATWFLSFLFIDPGVQASGVGRALLQRLLPTPGSPAAAPGALHHTVVDALQPISTGLYATFGLLPRLPIYALLGQPRDGALPALPAGLVATPYRARPEGTKMLVEPPVGAADLPSDLLTELDGIDRHVLGWRRRADHRRFLGDGRLLVRYHTREGAALGYGYAHDSGRAGPVALREPALLPAVLGDLLGRLTPAGAWRVYVPGISPALVPLIEGGLRIDGNPALWSARTDGPSWAGYLPASFALL